MKITLISTAPEPSDQGMRGLSSLLKKEGYKVDLIFMCIGEQRNVFSYKKNYKNKELEQLKKFCLNSDLIGINSWASTSKRAEQILRYLKKLNIPIVYGGVHATLFPEECIKYCDILCIGEGEGAILDLAKAIKENKSIDNIKNLWIKKDDKIIKNPVRELIDNLDSLPPPDYGIETHYVLDNHKIRIFRKRDLYGKIRFLTGRGCPYGCDYCANCKLNEIYEGKRKRIVRWHSIDYIIKQVRYLKEKFPDEFKYFDLRDDSFFMRPLEHFKEFNKKYKDVKIKFKCISDPRTLTDEKLKLLVDVGCIDLSLGVEGSEKTNKEIYHRNIDDEHVLKAVKIINKYKKQITPSYECLSINPYDKPEYVIDFIKLIRKFPKPYLLCVHGLTFFPGTKLYERAKKDGIIKSKKDTGILLKTSNRGEHLLLHKKNLYLNLILLLMRGVATGNRIGSLKDSTLDYLLEEKRIKRNLKSPTISTVFVYFLILYDVIRYKILTPIYFSCPMFIKKIYIWLRFKGQVHYDVESKRTL